jgi:hypothetical protein
MILSLKQTGRWGDKRDRIMNKGKQHLRSIKTLLIVAIGILIAFVFLKILSISFIVQISLLFMFFALIIVALATIFVKRRKKKNSFAVIRSVVLILAVPILIMNAGNIHKNVAQKMLQSTDLSDLFVDTMYVGMDMREFDKEKYIESDRFDLRGYSKGYNAFRLSEKDGKLVKIHADLSYVPSVALSIRHHSEVKTIGEVKSILGNHDVDAEYDNEQLYNSSTYIDKVLRVKAEFVYSSISNDLQAVLLSKY